MPGELSGETSWEKQELNWDLRKHLTPKPDEMDNGEREARVGEGQCWGFLEGLRACQPSREPVVWIQQKS